VGSTPSHQKWLPHPCFNQLVSSTKAIESQLFGGIPESLRKPNAGSDKTFALEIPFRAGKRADYHFNARGVKRYGWFNG
jgi:hypothetical protein